jgi:hypothetical protein
MLVSVPNGIELEAATMMSCGCSMCDKVFAEIGIPTLCTDFPRVACTSASDMKFTALFIDTSVVCRQTDVFIKA